MDTPIIRGRRRRGQKVSYALKVSRLCLKLRLGEISGFTICVVDGCRSTHLSHDDISWVLYLLGFTVPGNPHDYPLGYQFLNKFMARYGDLPDQDHVVPNRIAPSGWSRFGVEDGQKEQVWEERSDGLKATIPMINLDGNVITDLSSAELFSQRVPEGVVEFDARKMMTESPKAIMPVWRFLSLGDKRECTKYNPPFGTDGWFAISEEMGKTWFDEQFENRGLNENRVQQLCNSNREGGFLPDANTIKFSDIGGKQRMTDGQHRVLAAARTGIPIFSLVIFDVALESRLVNGIVLGRSLKQSLEFLKIGEQYETGRRKFPYGHCSTAINLAHRYDQFLKTGASKLPGQWPSNIEGSQYAFAHPSIVASAAESMKWGDSFHRKFFPQMVVVHYLIGLLDERKAEDMSEWLANPHGGNIYEGDPQLALGKAFQNPDVSMSSGIRQHDVRFGLTIKAFLAKAKGKKLRRVMYEYNDPFPVVKL